ncbi:hypothetical protein [Beijerinckia indica]|uniref:Uncharacterized protein n=1 Tax=Beijerinckia indica subsp. indica (strain ATCC 9039 / DSM 1715 / NCIMB 8712) TaxID=395963 RepID=B2IL66_BEII9|nr:hypothetical protein [Beijerinckia indica]ACB97266.1 hypothetical protein Bind_3714 [Beijerinckia indica subsp. indica ATCC 9039]
MKKKTIRAPRNRATQAMRLRAASAHVAVTSDTRPKVITPRKGKGSFCRNKPRQDDLSAMIA